MENLFYCVGILFKGKSIDSNWWNIAWKWIEITVIDQWTLAEAKSDRKKRGVKWEKKLWNFQRNKASKTGKCKSQQRKNSSFWLIQLNRTSI